MHISEGVLSAPVLATGAVVAMAGIGIGLRKMDIMDIPKAGLLSATFFVGSLIHVPAGPISMHLVLNGLAGILLGWMVFPTIFIGLLLQALFFQFGGLTTLGINTLNLAFPGLLCYFCFSKTSQNAHPSLSFLAGFSAGALAILGSAICIGISLYWTGKAFLTTSQAILLAHLPIMIGEGILTGFCILFLRRVKPELLR